MKRLRALVFAATVLAGCQSTAPPVDPFLRTRVPPPGTGEAAPPGAADSYYPGQLENAPAAPAGTNPYAPSGGSYRQGSLDRRGRTGREADRATASVPRHELGGGAEPLEVAPAELTAPTHDSDVQFAGAESDVETRQDGLVQANHVSVVRIIEPGSPSESASPSDSQAESRSAPAPGEPRRLVLPEGDVVSRLPADESSANPPVTGGLGRPEAAAGSRAAPTRSGAGTGTVATSSAGGARYGYDPQYRWLKGRLEYSQSDQQWKLRYIPIDGDTDDYGGSVVLSDSSGLEGYQPGDYVEARGGVNGGTGEGKIAPEYLVRELARLGR